MTTKPIRTLQLERRVSITIEIQGHHINMVIADQRISLKASQARDLADRLHDNADELDQIRAENAALEYLAQNGEGNAVA